MSLCEILEWDSQFFGRRIARLRSRQCSTTDLRTVRSECARDAVDCVYILVDAGDTGSIAAVQEHQAYPADIRVTFEADMENGLAPGPLSDCAGSVRPAGERDIAALRRIAAVSHRDTRFYADPHFARERCDCLYELWIEKSCRGYADAVFLIEDDAGHPGGYVTCHRSADGRGHIGLFAVREDMRGRGVGRQLLGTALRWSSTCGLLSFTVATQLRNVRALQFYGRAGLFISTVEMWFHLWPGDQESGLRIDSAT